MRTFAVPTAAVLALLLAAQASAQTPPRVQTRDFVTAASQSDQFETIEAKVVGTQSRNPRVQAFARQMVVDHAQTSATLRQAAARSGVTVPRPSLGGDQQKMLSELQSLEGPDLDKAYARQQVLAHSQALVTEQKYAAEGPDPNLRRAASTAIPIIRGHLDMAQRLRAEVGGS